jgi:hypothetical protein
MNSDPCPVGPFVVVSRDARHAEPSAAHAQCQHPTATGERCSFRSSCVYEGVGLCGKHLLLVKSIEDCAICMEKMQKKSATRDTSQIVTRVAPCGHFFHRDCLARCTTIGTCPACRSSMSPDTCLEVR